MNRQLIEQLSQNYKDNQLKAIKDGLGLDDAYGIFFDLPKIKNLIAKLEEVNTDPDAELGIRFNYASYPKAEDWHIMEGKGVSVEYAGMHTLIMIPTINNEFVEKDGDILALSRRRMEEDDSLVADNNGQLIPPRGGVGMNLRFRQDDELLAENHGGLIPPDRP